MVNPETGYTVTGEFAGGNEDLNATVYLAVDNDYLYFAADVIDDSYSYTSDGNWWEQDALQLLWDCMILEALSTPHFKEVMNLITYFI